MPILVYGSVFDGWGTTVVIKADGTLWAWGSNVFGAIGDGTTIDRLLQVQVGSDTDWRTVSGGSLSTAAIKSNGSLWAWGRNDWGQLGYSTSEFCSNGGNNYQCSTTPVIVDSQTIWRTISVGYDHILAIKDDMTLWVWGSNRYNALGVSGLGSCTSPDGTFECSTTPIQIGGDSDWETVAADQYFSMAIKSDGTLWAWGLNDRGQLGVGDTSNKAVPTQVGTDANWAVVSLCCVSTLGLKTDGSLWG